MQNLGHGGDAWDARESMDTVGFEKPQYNDPTGYPGPRRQASEGTLYPSAARTMSPAPTPAYHNSYDDPYYSNAAVGMGRPEASLAHPGQ